MEKLLSYGDPRDMGAEWPNYLELGFSREHFPELLRMLKDDDQLFAMSDSLEVWAPVHAWRTLGQLHAFEAVDTLIGLLKQIGTTDDDWLLEELPDVFGLIGPQALPVLAAYLETRAHGDLSRSCASGGIVKIGQVSPEHRADCVRIITAQLRQYGQNSAELNGLLICDLAELHAIESIEVIRGAFRERRVEIAIPGDLEDVEIELGLRRQRSTPQPRYISFGESQQMDVKKAKIGRNDPCPCGSGKKYKKCCLLLQQAAEAAQAAHPPMDGGDASFHLAELEIDRLSNSVLDLIESRRFDEAEHACRELSKRYPDQVDGLERSVAVHKAKGDYAIAAEYARQTIAFMKKRAGGYDPDLIAEMEDELRQLTSRLAGDAEALSGDKAKPLLRAEPG